MRHLLLTALLLAACGAADPLRNALPALPPTGGAAIARAGRLTESNFVVERVPGPASQGLVGDYFMRNDKVRLVVQAPGRFIGVCPFGGNVIDFDFVDQPAGDQLGEVAPFLQLGRTVEFTEAEVVRDGAAGGPAVLRFFGRDAMDDYIDIPGIGSFTLAIQDDYRATVDLKWRAAVTYVLMPHETRLRAIYTFYSENKYDRATTWGTITDSGANIETFHPYTGYGDLQFSDIVGDTQLQLVAWAGLQGSGISYGILPMYDDKTVRGVPAPIVGVVVEVYDVHDKFDVFGAGGQSLRVKSGGTATREVDLVLGRELGDVAAQASAARGEATVPLRGLVTPPSVGSAAGARVVVLDASAPPERALVTTLTADADGRFAGALPAGNYTLQAEGEAYNRGAPVTVTLPAAGDVTVGLSDAARLSYTIKDRAGAPIPGKISVVGAGPAPDRRFRDTIKDVLPYGVAAMFHSLAGDSSRMTAHDHPLPLAPGRYRVVVSRGPEWSRVEQVVDLTAAGARIDAVLDHVVPTPGYLATDFHQHSYMSPDSPVPPEDRVVSYLADGVDFISSSDHDVHFDYGPLVDALDARGLLDTAVGVETTPWDYGHFIGFPLSVDKNAPNGGALDWAGGTNRSDTVGLNLTPEQIFAGLRHKGAQVVQVNHPRKAPGAFSDFQQNFDRAGLHFDFVARTFFGDATLQLITAQQLGLPEDAQIFSGSFDSVESYNGFYPAPKPIDGERPDTLVENNLRDWMNFLSFGFTPTTVGDSDSHEWISRPAGLPRSLVRVPDDSAAALRMGVVDAVVATVTGHGVPKDVIVTNGPFLQMTVDGKGVGSTVAHAGGPLAIHLAVQTPPWAPVDTVEVFANTTYDVPAGPDGPAAMVPSLCFTSRATPSMRCAMALGGPRPLTVTRVETVPGQPSSARLEIVIDANDVTPDALAARQRAGAHGPDLWLVARASGDVGLFPVIPLRVDPSVSIADLVDRGDLAGRGVPALAFTNPIFVDVDGGGWRAPFAF
jgi:hypothetical protein